MLKVTAHCNAIDGILSDTIANPNDIETIDMLKDINRHLWRKRSERSNPDHYQEGKSLKLNINASIITFWKACP